MITRSGTRVARHKGRAVTARSQHALAANSGLARSKYTLFAIIAAMTLVVLYRDRVMLNPQH